VIIQAVNGVIVEYNEIFSHNHSAGEDGIDIKGSNNVVIRYNKIYDNPSQGINWQGGDNLDIYGNYIYGNSPDRSRNGIALRPDNDDASGTINIYNNIISKNFGRGLLVTTSGSSWLGGTVLNIVGNTFYSNNQLGEESNDIMFESYAPDLFRNNIVYGTQTQILLDNNFGNSSDIKNNHWYYSGSGDAQIYHGSSIILATDVDTLGHSTNPELANPENEDFKLSSISDSIDVADSTIGSIFEMAINPNSDWSSSPLMVITANQNDYGSGWERGAYVYLEETATDNNTPIACHQSSPSYSIPTGYGSPYNVAQDKSSELLIETTCKTTTVDVNVGNGSDLQYIYRKGYIYDGSSWQSYNLTGDELIADDWYVGNAQAIDVPVTDISSINYLVAYVCAWTGTEWKCGCEDNACANSYWQLQTFKR